MPFATPYPLINGHRFAFASIEIGMNGLPFPILGVKSINYSQDLEPGDIYGSRPQKLGRTRGKQNAAADMEMYRLEWEALRFTLGAGGIGYGEQAFDIQVQFSEILSPVVTDIIVGARITKAEFSNTEGTDASTVKLTFNVMRLLENNGSGMIAAPIGVGI